MNAARLVAAAGMSLLLSGCVMYQTSETRITMPEDPDEGVWSITMEMQSIVSDGKDGAAIQEDFDHLVNDYWQGDDYLLDFVRDGIYVKKRELFIRDGKLNGRVTGITNGERYKELTVSDKKWTMTSSVEVLATNGTAVELEKTEKDKKEKYWQITWPEETREFSWKTGTNDASVKADKSSAILASKFREYLYNHSLKGRILNCLHREYRRACRFARRVVHGAARRLRTLLHRAPAPKPV